MHRKFLELNIQNIHIISRCLTMDTCCWIGSNTCAPKLSSGHGRPHEFLQGVKPNPSLPLCLSLSSSPFPTFPFSPPSSLIPFFLVLSIMPSLPRREAAPEIQPGSLGSAIVTPPHRGSEKNRSRVFYFYMTLAIPAKNFN